MSSTSNNDPAFTEVRDEIEPVAHSSEKLATLPMPSYHIPLNLSKSNVKDALHSTLDGNFNTFYSFKILRSGPEFSTKNLGQRNPFSSFFPFLSKHFSDFDKGRNFNNNLISTISQIVQLLKWSTSLTLILIHINLKETFTLNKIWYLLQVL